MSSAENSVLRSLARGCELCGLCHRETRVSVDDHPPRAPSVVPSRTSAALPPDQVSLRSLPRTSPAPIPNPQPQSLQPSAITAPQPTPVAPVAPVAPRFSSAPQPTPDSFGTLQVSSILTQQQADLRQLWDEAIQKVKDSPESESLAEVIQAQDDIHQGDTDITLVALISRLENEMKRVGPKGKMADLVGKVVPHLNRFAIVGDIAVSTNPNPAALPWAAVRFILLNLTAGEEIRGKIIEGIAEITILELECSVYQEVHLTSPNFSHQPTRENLRHAIVEVFALSIKLLGLSLKRQRSATKGMTDAFRIEDFKSYVKDLTTAKVRLHDAGYLCDIYHNYESGSQLKQLHDMVRHDINEGADYRARMQLKDLVMNPEEAIDHIHHPGNSLCLEGTRVAVLQEIETWSSDPKSPCICWLPGLAGTGKSTISHTVARDLKGKSLGASFFFKTGAGNRGNGRFVFLTIAYQLALNFPPIRPHILMAVNDDPASAIAPMEIQWQRLILNPLSKLQDRELGKPLVLVIDALDECEENDRKQFLQILLTSCPAAIRVLISSRPVLGIQAQFAAYQQSHQQIVLHRVRMGTIKNDITLFLKHTIEEFVLEYNHCHTQKHLQMDLKWPGDSRFQQLVQMSVPLFIAAATFVRMIKNHCWSDSPDYKIDFIINESGRVNSPNKALYRPVLGLILTGGPEENRGRVVESFVDIIGSFVLLATPLPVTALANLLGIDARKVVAQIDPLRSVIDVPSGDGKIELFHLSFRDYLLSESAGELQVDEFRCHAKLASRCINLLKAKLKMNMCGLGSPGASIREIDPAIVDKCLSTEIQYASLYWAFHLKLSGTCLRDPGEDGKAQIVLEFLQVFFLNWMEVLCLLGKVDDSFIILDQLQTVVDDASGSHILQFIADARRFVHYFRSGIQDAPLQLYYAGVIFSPTASVVPQPLADRRYPDWIGQPSNIDSNWSQSLHTFDINGQYIVQMTFLPDGRLVSLSDHGQINTWDPIHGSCLLTVPSNEEKTSQSFSTSRDNKIAVPWSNSIEIWDNNNGTLSQKVVIKDHEVYEVAFTDDNKFICSRSRRLERDHEPNVLEPTGQDSEGGLVYDSDEEIIYIHNISTKECVREFRCGVNHSAPRFSPKGQWIAANETMLSRWDTYSDLCWVKLESDDKHTVWGFSVDGTLLASTTFDTNNHSDVQRPLEIKVWCAESNKCLCTYTVLDEELKPRNLRALALTKDLLVYMSVKWEAVFVHLKTGQISHRSDIRVFYTLAVSFDGGTLATQSSRGVIQIWDIASMSLAEPPNFHSGPVQQVAPMADENTVISMTRGEFKIWDISTGHCRATAKHTQDAAPYLNVPLTLTTATNAPLYATWSLNEIVTWRFDPVRGIQQLPQKYATAGNQLRNVAISANGQHLAAHLYDELHERHTVQIWDLKSARLLQTLDCNQNSHLVQPGSLILALSDDGARVAYETQDFIQVQNVTNPQPSTIRKLSYPNVDFLSHLPLNDGRILAVTRWIIQSFNDETGEEIERYALKQSITKDRGHKSSVDIEATHGTNKEGKRPISDVMKPYYILRDDRWLHKNGKDLIWLPYDYVPESVCVLGSTVIIGTSSGRLLFLYLRD